MSFFSFIYLYSFYIHKSARVTTYRRALRLNVQNKLSPARSQSSKSKSGQLVRLRGQIDSKGKKERRKGVEDGRREDFVGEGKGI